MTDHEKMILTKYDLMFESRLSRVETTLIGLESARITGEKNLLESIKEIKSDIRWIFGLMLGFQAIVLSLMAKGFHWL